MPHYEHPPIREAIIELRFEEKLEESDIYELKALLQTQYAPISEVMGAKFDFKIEGERVNSYQKAHIDGLDVQVDDNLTFIIRRDRVCWVRAGNYEEWASFDEPLNQLWRKVSDKYRLQKISRIGVRFINDIVIPFGENPKVNLEDYLTILTRFPDCFPGQPEGFNSRLQLDHRDDLAKSSVTVASKKVDKEAVHIILDIDVSRRYTNGFEGTFDELKPVLLTLRNIKNEIFESSITDNTRALFT